MLAREGATEDLRLTSERMASCHRNISAEAALKRLSGREGPPA